MTAGRVVSPDLSPVREKMLTRGRAAAILEWNLLRKKGDANEGQKLMGRFFAKTENVSKLLLVMLGKCEQVTAY
jgi:hypothetical protein